jgi:PAS domain S-box-containing protein
VAADRPDLILPDLILMDIQLAGEIDGITAAERICRVADIPIIFLTGFSGDPLLQRAKITAPYGYLIKPVSARELTATLEMALYKHSLDRQIKEINNELCLAQAGLNAARARYFDLYDMAPVGYCTLSEKGLILEANLTATALLGVARDALIKQPLTRFIHPDDKDIWYQHRKQLIETGEQQECELRMLKNDGTVFWTHLATSAAQGAEGEPVYRTVMGDITTRRRAEESLRANNELFSLFFRHSPIYIFIKEVTPTQSIVLQASDNFAQMIGIPSCEMVGKAMTELFPHDFAAKLAADDWAVVSRGDEIRLDEELNGRSYSTIKFPIIRGDKYLLAGYTMDITERKFMENELREARKDLEKKVQERTCELQKTNEMLTSEIEKRMKSEETLKESQAQYRLLSERTTDAVWLMDMNLNFIYHSPTVKMQRGFTVQEIMEMPLEQTITPESLKLAFELFSEEIPKVIADPGYNPVRTLELEYYCKDGSIMLTESKFSIIRDESGRPVSILGEARDIRERKRAEDVLRQSEARFKNLLQDVQSVAIQGYGIDGTTQYWNQASEQFYGYSAQEAIGRNLLDLIVPPEMRADVAQAIQQMAETGQPIPAAELSLMRKDGSRVSVFSNHTIVQVPGRMQELFCIDIDITERKQAEQERIAREAAEAANQAKSIFVANMSHEIRTPMNAILGFAQVLERDPSLTPQQAEHVRIIARSGGHLLHLINDILDMSKIEAGRTTLNEADFCLHDLLSDLELMFRSRADARGLQLLVERDESVPRYVTADEGKLRQVLVNLMGNAVKFTETGGITLRVRVGAVEGKTLEDNASLRLMAEVEDTGPGIPDTDRDLIFDPFQQTAAGAKAGGTGLGLAISHKFVEMMGGELTVTSQVGAGSCFRFEALLAQAGDIAEQEKPVLPCVVGLEPGAGPFRILVVDDISDNRILLCELLRPVGFEIAEASNGVEALDVFDSWSPHAVLMDMRMPIMDGYEATRRIKATAAGNAIPVIAVTASAFEDDFEQVMATGMYAYLRKPFRTEDLFEMLGKCLGLRYVFADDTADAPGHIEAAPLTAESITALPKDIVEAMQQAVEEGNMDRLTELVAQVEKIDSATARGLQVLTDRYDYEKLVQWLEKGGTDL